MSKPILEANAVVPLYRQLMEKLQKEITSGILKPGDRLPPKSKWRNITRSASSPHEKRWMNWQLRDLLKRNRGRAPL